MVQATRGTEKRFFDDATWADFPEHKYGWKLAADEPEEVTELKNETPAAAVGDTGADTSASDAKAAPVKKQKRVSKIKNK